MHYQVGYKTRNNYKISNTTSRAKNVDNYRMEIADFIIAKSDIMLMNCTK